MMKWEDFKEYIRQWTYVLHLSDYYHRQELEILNKYYTETIKTIPQKKLVFMVDGRSIHGGLADRLKGIVSIYSFAKKHNIEFKINATYPFLMKDYLTPNQYNWIPDGDIIYNPRYAKPILVNTHQIISSLHQIYLWLQTREKKEVHVYSNAEFGLSDFSNLFNELFKPSKRLQEDIDKLMAEIDSDYISVTFRFQQLLGDFKERNYPTLPESEQKLLIAQCMNQLDNLHKKHSNIRILVTSDSGKFLETVRSLDYVYVIPGKVVHMDYTENVPYEVYEKSFLDFFLIANAQNINLIYNDQMYCSGFPALAAKVNNRPFTKIKF